MSGQKTQGKEIIAIIRLHVIQYIEALVFYQGLLFMLFSSHYQCEFFFYAVPFKNSDRFVPLQEKENSPRLKLFNKIILKAKFNHNYNGKNLIIFENKLKEKKKKGKFLFFFFCMMSDMNILIKKKNVMNFF
ncbi:hypothetical protein RFI_27938 [Reticulomyxa filosa]|uniref:Uncharacterized protein n=1 Tax=Reticulomyxa filosa TaxID=46433 RepID=X6M749_RETFI|nr:hypothetical protein RFI_27938 [Reticulomyxa filosa]|eukprot:ETO09441.1 hypothetical protein RFI_27938 [Reticulomyxa filosa]